MLSILNEPFGNLGTSNSALALVLTLQKSNFCLTNLISQNSTFIFNTHRYFFLCLVIYQPRFFTYSFRSICGFLEKRPFVNFWELFSNTSILESFLRTIAGLPGSFPKTILEQLFCKEPVGACFCKKELHSRHYLWEFLKF